MRRLNTWLPILVACLCPVFLAQTPAAREPSRPVQPAQSSQSADNPFRINVDVDLVTLPVNVVDKDGRIVAGLTQDNFQVFEDKVQQDIGLFKHEDIPLNMGLVIDNSGSMKAKRERVHSAALSFVRESNPDDETFVIAFDDQAWLQQDFTGSLGDLVDALDELDPRNQTAMHDAIYLGIEHVKTGRLDKKVVLVISDGEDTASQLSYEKVLAYARNSKNVAVYAIGLLEESESGGGIFRLGRSPQKKAREALKEIAEVTGGRAYFPKSIDEVEAICRQIARELRNQYTIGYYPKNTQKDGSLRAIEVKVINPPKSAGKIVVNTKTGYSAPDANK